MGVCPRLDAGQWHQRIDLAVPNGIPRIILHITAGEARYTVDLNAKSARRAIAMIRELGPENGVDRSFRPQGTWRLTRRQTC